jgi:hypothetical protein
MKRTAFLIVLLGLVVLELLLLEGFVPYGWHHPISEALDHIFPSQEYKPHPNMDWEIEMVLRQHRLLRIGLYLFTAALATGNAFLISRVWKAWRRLKLSSPQT